ncbi:hypothetical protein GUITHDRAFT_131466 [Guillardia theta CCMP2712]|uniref:Ubiquitin-like domain-containing protein n=1 Tax=Guillardia theta (strain CCMP2712) TaxID=905079 RepID=L1K3Q9_GUITC|nr:hypothetical protein GUITHDRAFT_131466 [Guillardia theta CCMP2712]EKX55212.1 hypothetical protein GUITHDRAFT_131466 [Guillardia theta CCMP2712]|eukprot:XP_005842192.1 hypothetical protein GUITHDRAFT_131466 [Guillardia theta CCMP2712]
MSGEHGGAQDPSELDGRRMDIDMAYDILGFEKYDVPTRKDVTTRRVDESSCWYRERMKIHHPDKSGDAGNKVAMMLNQARDFLSAVLSDEPCDQLNAPRLPERYLHLVIKHLDKEIELRVSSESLVGQVKETIASEVQVPAQEQRLYSVHSGIELHDLRRLGSYSWMLPKPMLKDILRSKPSHANLQQHEVENAFSIFTEEMYLRVRCCCHKQVLM